MKYLTPILTLLLLVGISCQNNRETSLSNDLPIPVSVIRAETAPSPVTIHTSGRLSARIEAKLSFKTGGIIGTLSVEEGQSVEKGTLLASLDLSEIEAAKEQADQAYDKAVRDYNRVENLYRDSVATLEHLQNARTAMEIARTNREIAEFNLRYSVIEAPTNGKILLKLAEVNEIVGAGQPIILFGSSDAGWVLHASVPDRDIVRIHLGDRAVLHFDAYPRQTFEARVTQLGKATDPYTGTYEVELSVNPCTEELASGFMATAEILPQQVDSCLQVPADALVEADGEHGVLFVADNGIARKRAVTIGRISKNLCIEQGIVPGELVITDGSAYVTDGDSVIILQAPRP